MGKFSKIGWTDHTFNGWKGCTKVSAGCDHCYAERENKRYGQAEWGPHAKRIRTTRDYWKQPAKWNEVAYAELGRPARVFCASWSDVFENRIDVAWRRDLFDVIRPTTSLQWLLLTKRPQNIATMLPTDWHGGWSNVWLGTTTENQIEADRRIPHLIAIPAVVRFLSVEPMLGPVRPNLAGIDWVICGGESGPGKRPMDLQWARDLRDQCKEAGIAFFMKQIDQVQQIPDDLLIREYPAPRFDRLRPVAEQAGEASATT